MPTKPSGKTTRSSKNRSKRIHSVKRLESVRTLKNVAASMRPECLTMKTA